MSVSQRARRKSRRENELLYFETEAEWLKQIPLQNKENFSKHAPEDVMIFLKKVKTQSRGYIRCLASRIVFKQKETGFSHKPRLLDVPYVDVKQYYLEEEFPSTVILGIERTVGQPLRSYEIVRFKDPKLANRFADQLDQRVENITNMQQGYSSPVSRPQVNSKRPKDAAEHDAKSASALFIAEGQFLRFDADALQSFPKTIPLEITTALDENDFDEQGRVFGYDDRVEMKYNKAYEDGFEYIWQADYKRVSFVQTLPNHPKTTIWAMMNKERGPSHYGILKLNDSQNVDILLKSLAKKNVSLISGAKPSSPTAHKRKSRTIGRVNPVMEADNSSPHISRASSVEMVRHSFTQSPDLYSSGNNNKNNKKGTFQVESLHKYYAVRPVKHLDGDPEKLKSDMSRLPDDDVWDTDLAFLDEDPKNGTIMVKDGPVFMYIARKTNPRD